MMKLKNTHGRKPTAGTGNASGVQISNTAHSRSLAVVNVKEYFYTTGMDISGKQWHRVRAHTRRMPKRRQSK